MDIQYLLFLQGLRENAPNWLNVFFSQFSEISNSYLCVLVPLIVFWCVSKNAGSYLLFNFGAGQVMNTFIKDIACVYRPWIRDSRIETTLKATATGYSFPSGHTTSSVSLYTGSGVLLKDSKKGKLSLVIGLLLPMLTGFCRNWVGAHTPQDVVVGYLTALILVIASVYLFRWLEENPDKDVRAALISVAVTAAILVFVTLKPYPVDLGPTGNILVEPYEMQTDAYKAGGAFIGFMTGWILERRLIRFRMEAPVWRRIVRALLGVGLILVLNEILKPALLGLCGEHWGYLLTNSTLYIIMTAAYPFVFSRVGMLLDKRAEEKKADHP